MFSGSIDKQRRVLWVKEELTYLRIENHRKIFVIKSLTETLRFMAPVFPSETNQGKLHEHDREHKLISENRLYDSSKVLLQM